MQKKSWTKKELEASVIAYLEMRDKELKHEKFINKLNQLSLNDTTNNQWSHSEVIRDRRFYQICLVTLAPAFIITGLFFHQIHLQKIYLFSNQSYCDHSTRAL